VTLHVSWYKIMMHNELLLLSLSHMGISLTFLLIILIKTLAENVITLIILIIFWIILNWYH